MDIELLAHRFYDYSQHIRGYSPFTIRRYKRAILICLRYAHTRNIEDCTEERLRELFFFGRTQRKWSSGTYICYYHSLKVFFDWCVSNKYISQNPLRDIEIPKLEKRIPKNLAKGEALRLLEVVYNYPYEYKFLRFRNHAIFATYVFAGLRRGELLNLKFTDVDLENLTIFVRQGKGAKDRIVPISYTLAQILKRYVEERKRLNKTCPEFFTSLNRNMGFTSDGLKHLISDIKRASGINVCVHKLRHTFATLMLEGGCDIYSLSRMMGHSDIKTTTIYLSATVQHLREQVGKHPLNDISTIAGFKDF